MPLIMLQSNFDVGCRQAYYVTIHYASAGCAESTFAENL